MCGASGWSLCMTFAAGQTGGEYKHTLSVDEMPSHYHASKPMWAASSGSGSNNVVSGYPTTGKAGQYGINTENTGGGKSHNNIQPWATAYFWRRTA